jgi:hypothetical protein
MTTGILDRIEENVKSRSVCQIHSLALIAMASIELIASSSISCSFVETASAKVIVKRGVLLVGKKRGMKLKYEQLHFGQKGCVL